jgi:predicted alpha/beta superfamily hydrolase
VRIYLRIVWIILISFVYERPAFGQNGSDVHPYQVPHTDVRKLHSEIVSLDYVLYISLPRNYATSSETYPVVFTLDADYAFALAHNIVEHFVDRGNLPEMIIVSIAYEGASQEMPTYRRQRTRDYTPTFTLEGGYGPDFQKYSGGGKNFLEFIAEELIPFIAAQYRVRPNDRTFVGHSYGGLFGAYVLLTQPETFQRYILVSSSFWYDDRVIFRLEKSYGDTHGSLPAKVFFAVGGLENQPMLDDMQELIKILQSRSYKELTIASHVFEDETHNSVFPAALTRGLRAVFSGE